MAYRDLGRYKKSYSFYRAVPVLQVTSGDITSVVAGNGLSGGGIMGDVTLSVNDSVVATISGSTFTGVTKHNAGLSGSLTRLTNGNSYIIGGTNVTVTSASNGSITISATGGSPGGSTTHVQYNNGGSFAGSANFTFNGSTVFLSGGFSQGGSSFAIGSNSHSEGFESEAQGDYSHAEAGVTFAVGSYSHSEGYSTEAIGYAAHSEGFGTSAQGDYSHAEGDSTTTKGNYSHAAGTYTIASGSGQNVVGKYNKRGNTDSLFIIGNGSGFANAQRDDIFLVNSGSILIGSASLASDTFFYVGTKGAANTALFAGNAQVSGTLKSSTGLSGSLTKLIDGTSYLIAGSNITITSASNGAVTITSTGGGSPGGSSTHIQVNNAGVLSGSGDFTYNGSSVFLTGTLAAGNGSKATGVRSFAQGENCIAIGNSSHAQGKGSIASGNESHSEGDQCTASGGTCHAEGYYSFATQVYDHAEGFNTTASGYASHSEGASTVASGQYSHTEGQSTIASATAAHAEGYAVSATGQYSHAEGDATTASGKFAHTEGSGSKGFGTHSHAEGNNTHAVGDYSHTAGIFTIASGSGQNVVGKYNKRTNTDSLFIVGNGNNDTNAGRSDIFLVNTGSVLIGSGNLNSDTFFFVSGSANSSTAKSLFGGDVVISGTLNNRNPSAIPVHTNAMSSTTLTGNIIGTTETAFANTITIPANTLAAGDIIHLYVAKRRISNSGATSFNSRVRYTNTAGSIIGSTSGTWSAMGTVAYKIEIVVANIGASGVFVTHSMMWPTVTDTPQYNVERTTVDTTSNIVFVPCFQFSAGSPDASDIVELEYIKINVQKTY